ncbi:hypothetical protein OWR29_39305 [Actinoplanes sp. Pm04-4]|uniref:Condensation domain-containing protein n=1 Tax=Paractinoplanes pyxinae TaxID=2997416 RepID=A0ABT4BC37_9ACTN|nr:hypothetical protein [Actinoplanes pyxinae]MCY1144080.1 hypothetical protein [Actinoplanes pyxinae]
MTRAQKFQWFLEAGFSESLRPLPVGTELAAAQRIVDCLENKFHALRTSIEVIDGELQQRVHRRGLPVRAADVAADETPQLHMARIVERFKAEVQGRTGLYLAQFHLLERGAERWLGFVADHVAMDADFRRVVENAIGDAVADPVTGRQPDTSAQLSGIQPTDMARLESGPQGEAERQRASDLLQQHFATAPPRMHRYRPSSGISGRYYRRTLTLQSADIIFAQVMSTAGLLPSALILAAFTQLLCWRGKLDACTVNVARNNRHNADLRNVRCTTAQRSPVTFRRLDQGMRAAAAGAQRALAEGHPTYGRYDPFDLLRERVLAQHSRGISLSTDLAYNFIPPPHGWHEVLKSGAGRPDQALEAITYEVTDESFYEYGASLSVRWSDARTVRISIHGDSQALAAEDCGALLRGIELVLSRVAAGQDCVAGDVAAQVGLAVMTRHAGEQLVNGHWVDFQALEDKVLAMDWAEEVKLIIDAGEAGNTRLTIRVTAAEGKSPAPHDVRNALLRHLDTGELLAVPDHYEIVGGAPVTLARGPEGSTESAVQSIMAATVGGRIPDLDECFIRAGGQLARYPEFADLLRRRGYLPPSFACISGMTTLRTVAGGLRRAEASAD